MGAATDMLIKGVVDAAALGEALVGPGGGVGAVAGGVFQFATSISQAAGTSLNIFAAQAGNVGRLMGKELDRLFGGDGDTGMGAVMQASGFAAALVVSSYGLAYIPVVGQVLLLVLGIGSAISDGVRLSYGREGASRDALVALRERWAKAILAGLRSAKEAAGGELQTEDVRRVYLLTLAYCIGYEREAQAQKERAWKARPWGVGQSAQSHLDYGAARGWFVPEDRFHALLPELRANSSMPPGALELDAATWAAMERTGAAAANVTSYLRVMKEARGFGVSDVGHAVWWRKEGAFRGEVALGTGDLIFEGVRVDWKASHSAGKPVFTR